jgi:uncharacterized protein YndB with AHSA1/START domain
MEYGLKASYNALDELLEKLQSGQTSMNSMQFNAGNSLTASRVLDAPQELVYAAITTPEHLKRWFGPAGFTNSFTVCDVRPGGKWLLTMHGPDGKDYYNEWEFAELTLEKVVLVHTGPGHRFVLTLTLTALDEHSTRLDWLQEFENAEDCDRVRSYAAPANEQNIQRLAALVAELRGNTH